ncbi:MAG TPA: class I SAM-dependent methyltransferase [Opitutaceae bacterium]|nr:class I SAM-dependent methyltransferase [Opitutaceae bacterium]
MNIHSLYARLSPFFRRRRRRRFFALVAPRAGERVLDVGGTADFWRDGGLRASLTLLNRDATADRAGGAPGEKIVFVVGDGCALPFRDGEFDVVFSNSVIEHVGSWERQQAFAAEARRVGRRLWVQTPARGFFIEPHLLAPFIHWLPRAWQRRLVRNFTVRGWLERPDAAAVEAFLDEVRLLTFREMQALFPDCAIRRERFLGLTKSYLAVRVSSPSGREKGGS